MRKDYSKLLWGLVIVAVGVVFSGNVLDWWNVNLFFPGWWTLFLIVPGVISICKNGFSWGPSILVIIGGVLLIDCLDIVNTRIIWRLVIPILIIALGLSIIFSFFRNDKDSDKEKITFDTEYKTEYKAEDNNTSSTEYDNSQYPNFSVIFGSRDFKLTNPNLKGIKVEGVFSGIVIDLRDAQITNDIVLDISNIFSGVDIYVPSDVNVETLSGTPILGGLSYRENKNIAGAPKIKVKYTSIFGGIDIK